MTHLVSYRWRGDKLEALQLYDNNGKVVSDLIVSTTARKKGYLFYRFECTTPECIVKVQTLIIKQNTVYKMLIRERVVRACANILNIQFTL